MYVCMYEYIYIYIYIHISKTKNPCRNRNSIEPIRPKSNRTDRNQNPEP